VPHTQGGGREEDWGGALNGSSSRVNGALSWKGMLNMRHVILTNCSPHPLLTTHSPPFPSAPHPSPPPFPTHPPRCTWWVTPPSCPPP
jgi:hypothetical protein